jgi:hypothetical protein
VVAEAWVRTAGWPSWFPELTAVGFTTVQATALDWGPHKKKVTVPVGATSPPFPVTVATSASAAPSTMVGRDGAVVTPEPVAVTVKHSSVEEPSAAER